MAVSIPAAAGLASAGASIFGSLKGKSNAGQVQMPQMWQMPNMTPAANNAFADIGNLPATQYGSQFLPAYESATRGLINNPYAGQYQTGSNVAGAMGQGAAANTFNVGGDVTNAGMSLVPGATAVMNTAFDPQQALYARTLQQLTDQTRAAEAARGLSTTPYGAGVEGKTLSDFNIDWANAQLGRQTQGLDSAGRAITSAGGAARTGQGLQNAAAPLFQSSSGMPYGTAETIGRGQQQDISGLFTGGGQAQTLAQQPIQDYLSYLGVGNQAGSVANQAGQLALNRAGMDFNQNQTLGAGLGAGLGGLANQNNWNWLNSVFQQPVAQPGNTPFVPYGPGY